MINSIIFNLLKKVKVGLFQLKIAVERFWDRDTKALCLFWLDAHNHDEPLKNLCVFQCLFWKVLSFRCLF